jgi:UDP-N-acetylmuramoyl-tripeptide--D-alanyl-D-alanine ligase
MRLKVKEALAATGGVMLRGGREAWLGNISTDTRTLKPGQAFLALSGDRFDGHEFIESALRKGAGALIISKMTGRARVPDAVVVIQVKETLKALGDLAGAWRKKFPARVVAVTGSNGKTTTKEMTAQAISGRYRVLRNFGNLNNLVGLPLSLFRLDRGYDAAVLEMGTNHLGEISRLVEIARPEVGVITNIGPVHLEGLKSLSGVLKAKSELIKGLAEDASFVLNLDSKGLCRRAERFPGKVFGFSAGLEGGLKGAESLHLADVCAEVFQGRPRVRIRVQAKVDARPRGREVELWISGLSRQNALNALAAMATARALAVPLDEAGARVCGFRIMAGRGRVFRTRRGAIVIDESYNANPVSMRMALENLRLWKKASTGIAALGEMMELGKVAGDEHWRLGREVAGKGIDLLMVQGEHASALMAGARKAGMGPERILFCRSNSEMSARLAEILHPGDWVLVKGSRRMKMEEVVNKLVKGGRRVI